MHNRLGIIEDRLDRADEHVESIKDVLRSYYTSHPYQLRGEFDPADATVTPVGQIGSPPLRLYTLVGEFLHDLRSGLDHLAWELVHLSRGTPSDQTRFPVLKVPPTPNKQGVSPPPPVAGGLCPDAARLVDKWQPYQWGSAFALNPLWILHRLSIIDKHRHLAIRGLWLREITFSGTPAAVPFAWHAEPGEADEHGAEIRFVPDDPTVDMHGGATLQVVVHEAGPGISEPVLKVVEDCVNVTRSIVIEADETLF